MNYITSNIINFKHILAKQVCEMWLKFHEVDMFLVSLFYRVDWFSNMCISNISSFEKNVKKPCLLVVE